MWNDISEPWKVAFSQGWLSYKNGSIPIGAVVTDEAQNIISVGRNKLYENINFNPKIAHAEIEC
ncbi:MAG: nucleoside deaminase, partial [Clostridia bacterium]|nr:nucleoside deaminase [Clostridia bacterium]